MREFKREQRRRKRRAALALLICLILVALILILIPEDITAGEPLTVITVQVKPGDSLWKLAANHNHNRMDLRKYIYLIEKYNNLESANLQPGQQLQIPLYERPKRAVALTSDPAK